MMKDKEKDAKEDMKKERRNNLRKLKKKSEEALEGLDDGGTLVKEVDATSSPESVRKKEGRYEEKESEESDLK